MADEKNIRSADKKKVSVWTKVIRFFQHLPKAIAAPFKNMWRELKKVTWPSRKDLLQYTMIVLIFMAFMGLVIGLLDMGASRLIRLMVGA